MSPRIAAPFVCVFLACAARPVPAATTAPAAVALPSDDAALRHLLDRAAYGPRPGQLALVREAGAAAWIEAQLHPERIDDAAVARRLAAFETLELSTGEIVEEWFLPAVKARRDAKKATREGEESMEEASDLRQASARVKEANRVVLGELSAQKLIRAIESERQLEEVLTDFWLNHFNVFAAKGATRALVTGYERDVIRPHVLGSFRELLGATAKSPAMLFYLDNWMSAAPDARAGAKAKKRFGGLNENYGRELLELHTLGVDGGYTQADVVAVARCFTGWTIDRPKDGLGFRFEPRLHDRGAKVVLGTEIPAGGGLGDGERVLDLLAKHPSTARFVATKLARRFVADDPPAALVDRLAAVFRDTDGDLRAVTRAVLTSPEFWADEARGAKVKTPFEFVASSLRVTGTHVGNPVPLVRALHQLGQPPYLSVPPTGWPDRAEAWVSTGALLDRLSFATALASDRVPGSRVDAGALGSGADALAIAVLGRAPAPATREVVERGTTAQQRLALLLGAPEFQRR